MSEALDRGESSIASLWSGVHIVAEKRMADTTGEQHKDDTLTRGAPSRHHLARAVAPSKESRMLDCGTHQ